MSETLLKPDAAAKILDISPTQLRDLTKEGLLRWINIGLGHKRPTRRYSKEDLEEFIRERSVKCRSTSGPVKTHIPMTSSYEAVDFLAILAQRKSEMLKTSKISKRQLPKRK